MMQSHSIKDSMSSQSAKLNPIDIIKALNPSFRPPSAPIAPPTLSLGTAVDAPNKRSKCAPSLPLTLTFSMAHLSLGLHLLFQHFLAKVDPLQVRVVHFFPYFYQHDHQEVLFTPAQVLLSTTTLVARVCRSMDLLALRRQHPGPSFLSLPGPRQPSVVQCLRCTSRILRPFTQAEV
jgi:hypothetical protein